MIGKNNPLNVRYNPLNKWKGQIGSTKGFCDFESLEFGVRAAAYLILRSYKRKGFKTYAQIIQRFAPPSENKTNLYFNYVCNKCNSMPFDVPSGINEYVDLLYAMSHFEGNPLSWLDIKDVIKKYFSYEDYR